MILERLKEYIDFKKVSISAFERSIGMSNASFRKCLQNNGAIGSDKIEKIFSVYEDLSAEWLMTGRGGMIIQKDLSPATSLAPSIPTNDIRNSVVIIGNWAEFGAVVEKAVNNVIGRTK